MDCRVSPAMTGVIVAQAFRTNSTGNGVAGQNFL
jgi:hypothetical protein